MLNAEEIIEIEKKWLKYKIKQKSKFFMIFIILLSIIIALIYFFYISKENINIKTIKTEKKLPLVKETIKPKTTEYVPIKPYNNVIDKNISTKPIDKNITKNIEPTKIVKKGTQEVVKNSTTTSSSYHLKLEPTEQANELFSTNSFLTFNSPIAQEIQTKIKKDIETASINKIENIQTSEKKKPTISIGMKDMNTIAYLKEKFYSTSSIVFALMLAEEYYYDKNYNESLKWSLTANDIDSQNTKTWYWFAKSKVKLNQKEDAIRALKAYLTNNNSKRLNTLLHKIELGETND